MARRKIVEFLEERLADVRALPRQKEYLTADGREKPDATPMAPPLGYKKQPTLHEQIRSMIVSERLRQEAMSLDAETLEEADDFEIGDFDPTSPYEYNFDPPTPVHPGTMGAAEKAEYDEWRANQFAEWKNFRKAVKEAAEANLSPPAGRVGGDPPPLPEDPLPPRNPLKKLFQ